MPIRRSALLVEDDAAWSEIYARAASQAGIETVARVRSHGQAASEIAAMRFGVALIDIGLSEDDDTNVDGLRVMDTIREAGDPTSIVVITGRSGGDVLPIVRDSLQKYNAFDILAKRTLGPSDLRTLIEAGLRQYQLRASEGIEALRTALRGDMEPFAWDDMLLRTAVTRGGAPQLYRLIHSLFAPFTPLLPGERGGVRVLDGDLACGVFWSRGAGMAVVACFGSSASVTTAAEVASKEGMLLGRYPVGEAVGEYASRTAKGVIFRLQGQQRSDF